MRGPLGLRPLAGLRSARGATAALGVFAAALMVGTAATVGVSLSTGFDRAAERADLPDLVVRFHERTRGDVDRRIAALPNLEARSYRLEVNDVPIRARGQSRRRTAVEVVGRGRRGYAVVSGTDLRGPGEVLMERGLARAWEARVGDRVRVGRLGALRLAGIVVAPDDVAYPLISRPRVWISNTGLGLPPGDRAPVNSALVWVRDRSRLDATLVQARAVGFGLRDLRYATRNGLRVLVDRAAGIVIALLVAFSLVAAGAACLMLGASARADVESRLTEIGVMRASGFSRRGLASGFAVRAALAAAGPAGLGLCLGALIAHSPAGRLLDVLSELPPSPRTLAGLLLVPFTGMVGLVAITAGWPAWRAASRPPAELLRGGDLAPRPRRVPWSGTAAGLGVRIATARPVRWLATVTVLASALAVLILMLGLSSFLSGLQDDPGSLGRRYQLTASLPAERAPEVARIPGVEAAQARYEDEGFDSFELGEPVKLIAFRGDHTEFESAPLKSGRRIRGRAEAEVGLGLADALGLRVGSRLAVQLSAGREARFRVVGIVRAIDNDGRVAYVHPARLLLADPGIASTVAVRLAAGADRDAVERRLEELGARPRSAAGIAGGNGRFLGILAGLLRLVAGVNALVCFYALLQALGVVARERRSTLAVLRAGGASRRMLGVVLAGASAAAAVPALLVALAVERYLLGPLVARLAAGYASLPLRPGAAQLALVASVVGLLCAAAAALTARAIARRVVAADLRER